MAKWLHRAQNRPEMAGFRTKGMISIKSRLYRFD